MTPAEFDQLVRECPLPPGHSWIEAGSCAKTGPAWPVFQDDARHDLEAACCEIWAKWEPAAAAMVIVAFLDYLLHGRVWGRRDYGWTAYAPERVECDGCGHEWWESDDQTWTCPECGKPEPVPF